MKAVLFIILLALPLAADDWKDKLSPEGGHAFRERRSRDAQPLGKPAEGSRGPARAGAGPRPSTGRKVTLGEKQPP